mmetsp:Transcript_113413/g.315439  ORF Transcript_113413/g.315439 Transcript_113413/m.315439 type:complete len:265 (-) Transcript_113413:77-871(-)
MACRGGVCSRGTMWEESSTSVHVELTPHRQVCLSNNLFCLPPSPPYAARALLSMSTARCQGMPSALNTGIFPPSREHALTTHRSAYVLLRPTRQSAAETTFSAGVFACRSLTAARPIEFDAARTFARALARDPRVRARAFAPSSTTYSWAGSARRELPGLALLPAARWQARVARQAAPPWPIEFDAAVCLTSPARGLAGSSNRSGAVAPSLRRLLYAERPPSLRGSRRSSPRSRATPEEMTPIRPQPHARSAVSSEGSQASRAQ